MRDVQYDVEDWYKQVSYLCNFQSSSSKAFENLQSLILIITFLNVQEICSKDQLKEGSLVNFEEVCIPGADVICPLFLVFIIFG